MNQKKFETITATLKVSRKEYLTPHYIRIYLQGEEVASIANTTVGVNNKILIPPRGLQEVYFPEFDYAAMQWKPQPAHLKPTVRTYTHRGINLDTNEIWIDFVAHGDEGPASAWAASASEGSVLGILMKSGKTELYPQTDQYLLVGDATAIPVLGAILEDLCETATGTCIIEVSHENDIQELETRANISFVWLINPHPQQGSNLFDAVKRLELPEGKRFAYVAAEFRAVKAIRTYLRKERGWGSAELNAYSYWKSGVTEDQSAMERKVESEA